MTCHSTPLVQGIPPCQHPPRLASSSSAQPRRSIVERRRASDSGLPSLIAVQQTRHTPSAMSSLTPQLRVTRPSLSPGIVDPPPPAQSPPTSPVHPFAAAVSIRSPTPQPKGIDKARDQRPEEGRAQTVRRGVVAPTGIISRIASKASLSSLGDRVSAARFLSVGSSVSRRPAPPSPCQDPSTARFAPSSASRSPPSLLQHGPIYSSLPHTELVEIPRFKMRQLNLGIVNKRGPWKAVWLVLWAWWIFNGLLSLFFDVNVMFILVQCIIHPSSTTNSSKSWTFATTAYAICWGISTFVIWMGWEFGYEFWRRWRTSRPAVEPIYLSLPASLHLALSDYNYFIFLVYIRLSPWDTAHATDLYPEACYALVQLGPGLVVLLPRAAIAIVVLISFYSPQRPTTFGSVDDSQYRDPHFFRSDRLGELTVYAKAVLIAFASYVGLRLIIVMGSIVGLWAFSGKPFGRMFAKPGAGTSPTTPRRPKSSLPPRDPHNTASPQKSWLSAEDEFDWSWRERTRARIQDAYELCMIRKDTSMVWHSRSRSTMPLAPLTPAVPLFPLGDQPHSASEFMAQFVGHLSPSAQPRACASHEDMSALPTTPRPESTMLPEVDAEESGHSAPHPPVSRGVAEYSSVSGSSHDVFYTPQVTPTPSRNQVSEHGQGRLSHDSEESLVDDSAALIPSSSVSSNRDRSSSVSTHDISSRSSSLRRRDPSHSLAGGRVLLRARSTSVGLLRDSIANANGIAKRARSGTMLSVDSGYERMDPRETSGPPATLPRRRTKLGIGHPLAAPDVRFTTA